MKLRSLYCRSDCIGCMLRRKSILLVGCIVIYLRLLCMTWISTGETV